MAPCGLAGHRQCTISVSSLKPATGRPCVLASGDSGTVPAITCDCSPVAELLMRRRYFDLCVTAASRTMLTFENNVSCSSRDCSTIACCRLYVDVNTLASKRSELLGNADIFRMRRVIHKTSTCVCLRIPVAAITQKRKNASVDLWPALLSTCVW